MTSEWEWPHKLPYHWKHLCPVGSRPVLYICSGTNQKYRPYVRWGNMRKYIAIGRWTRSKKRAARQLADTMTDNPNYNRGVVLMAADYYDPIPVLEMKRP